MSDVRCVYCGDLHAQQPLPYKCPGCGRELRVKGMIGGSLEEQAREEMMLVEDRRCLDHIDRVLDATGHPLTYRVVEGGRAIKCLRCGLTSYNPNDVEHRYCGKCGYHDDAMLSRMVRQHRSNEES